MAATRPGTGRSNSPDSAPGAPSASSSGAPSGAPTAPSTGTGGRDGELARLAEEYFDTAMTARPFGATVYGVPGYDHAVPDPSRAADQRRGEVLDGLAGRLADMDPKPLSDTDRVTYAMLGRQLRDDRAMLDAGLAEVAISGGNSGRLSAVAGVVPAVTLTGEAAARDYLARLRGLAGYFDAVLRRHDEAVADGRFPVASGVRQAVGQVDDYLATPLEQDPLLRPARPGEVGDELWRAEARAIVEQEFRPALRRYRDGLDRLLPRGRDDEHVGVCHVPGGVDGYRHAVRAHTTTELTPEEIHRLGLGLVERLAGEFAELGGRVLGTSDVPEVLERLREDPALRFEHSSEIAAYVTEALRRAEAAVPDWFRPYDIAPCQVTEMSEIEAKGSVLGYYLPPSADGSRPGTHCVNTYLPQTRPRFEYEVLAFHESVPGHHLQFGIGQTLTGLPAFRRFGYVTAHSEGWGLYVERLCDQMGLYTSDLSRLGMLSFDAWRACRLVVDTGMHHFGWSRTRAVDFMRSHTALSRSNIANEVDRYIAAPGQALAYMIGRIRIDELRERARTALGAAFDIKEFHHHVLAGGSVPLDVLTEVVDRWLTTT